MPADLNTPERGRRALESPPRPGRVRAMAKPERQLRTRAARHPIDVSTQPTNIALFLYHWQFRILARMRATSIRGRTGVPGTPNSTAVRRDGCIAALRLHLQSTT